MQQLLDFVMNPWVQLFVVVSWTSAFATFLLWKKNGDHRLVYAHLVFLLAPLLAFAIKLSCTMSFVQGLLSLCTMAVAQFFAYLIPIAATTTIILSLWIIPLLYKRHYDAVEIKSEIVGSKSRIYLLDTAKPIAFSTRKNIFVSVGMHELLSSKELEAVLLHELGHIKNNSSAAKLSWLLSRFTIARFSFQKKLEENESKADDYAIKMQGSERFLNSAKRKVEGWERYL